MEAYEKLLKKAYSEVKLVGHNGERFEIPKVCGEVGGNMTHITNINQIASCLRRDVNHLVKFLLKELAVSGKLDSSKLSLKGRLSSVMVNEKIERYANEFVICPVCKKPDTEIISEKEVKLRHCLACGAKSPVKYHL